MCSEFIRVDPASADDEGRDSDDSDYDEELDRRVQVETLQRAWATWNVAGDTLKDEPEAFCPSNFGIIAMGAVLEIIKKIRMRCAYEVSIFFSS